MRTSMIKALGLCLLIGLPGCSAIGALTEASETLNAYEVRGLGAGFRATRSLNRDLTIEAVSVSGALATDRILIRPSALEAQYLPAARWTDEAPEMMRTVLLRRFEDSGAFRFVGRRPLAAIGDYALLTELTDLQAEVSGDESTVARISLIATVVREDDAAVIGHKRFSAVVPAANTSAPAVVSALEQATAAMFRDLGPWVLERVGTGARLIN